MLTWLKHGLLLSNGRRRHAKITNSFALSEACAIHVGFFSEISLSSDLVLSLHFWSNTKLKVLPWKPRAVQSRLNKDYSYIYIYSSFLSRPFLQSACLRFLSSQKEVRPQDRQLDPWSSSYLRQTHYSLTDLFRTNTLLIMSLVQALPVFTFMTSSRCKTITLQPINTFKRENEPWIHQEAVFF